MSNDQQQAIRESAYRKWEAAGCPEGCDLSFWLEAERELDAAQRPRPSSESPAVAKPPLAKTPVASRVAEPPRAPAATKAATPPRPTVAAKPVTPPSDARPESRRGKT